MTKDTVVNDDRKYFILGITCDNTAVGKVFITDFFGMGTIFDACEYFENECGYKISGISSPRYNTEKSLRSNPGALVQHVYNSICSVKKSS